MIFEHFQYRTFLKAQLSDRKKNNPRYSQRAFAKFLGVSPGQFNLVLQGKKRISQETAIKIASRLSLKDKEKDFLCTLVQLESAKTPEVKEFISKRLQEIHPRETFYLLELDAFKVISNWYHYAILEMTDLDYFKSDSKWIAKRLGISKEEAELALERLERLGLLHKKNERWLKTNEFVVTKSEMKNEALRKFHRQILEKALDSIESQSIEERELGSMTMSIDPSKIKEAKKRMLQFRLEMAKFLSKGKKTETYVFSTELFKLTTGGM